MARQKSPKQLSKFISYMLGRKPAEFGLVPDQDGFVKIKDLLKAVTEEEGWKYVRRSHLDEILYSWTDPPFEILDKQIRAKCRDQLSLPKPIQDLPRDPDLRQLAQVVLIASLWRGIQRRTRSS